MDLGISLFDFLMEAELHHYYDQIKTDLKILKTSQLKYVTDEDLTLLGMSRPEQRRLKKFFTKYYPQNYLSRIKRLLGPGKKDEHSGWLGALSEERAHEVLTEAPDSRAPGTPNKHIIPAESITINKELGVGEFGVVQQGVWTNDGHRIQVAIKCLSRERMHTNSMEFLKEAAIMYSIEHKSIVRLYGVVLHPDSLMLVTELAPLRSLLECLKEISLRTSFPVLTLCEFALQICDGMSYLENKRLIHRDLAARNILVFTKNKVKISDFGLSRALGVGKDYYQTNFNVNLKLPIAWCAPECISYLRFTSASDVWAYAVTLWEMFSYGFQPWAAFSGHQILVAIDAPNFQRLEQPECCPREYFTLMQKCWHHESTKRPKFSEIIHMLPDCKPEQVQAVSTSEFDPNTKRADQLFYKGGDIITVIDKGGSPAATQWKGILTNGTTGSFNPQNVVSYLGASLPSSANQNVFTRSTGEGAGSSIRNSLIRDRSASKRRLRSDMISAPQGEVKHTGHVGLDGAYFGDVSFLEYNHLPRQVVTPYKPSEDLEQTPLINPNSPSHLTGNNTVSSAHPILLRETHPRHGAANHTTQDDEAKYRNSTSFNLDSLSHQMPQVMWPGSKIPSDGHHSAKGRSAEANHPNDSDGNIDPELQPHEYQEISDDDDQKPSADFGQPLLEEMESIFRSLRGHSLGGHSLGGHSKASATSQDHEGANYRNELAEQGSRLNHTATLSKKKQTSVKQISGHDKKMLDSAIALANELTAKSMTDLEHKTEEVPLTPTTPNERSKFHFRFPLGSHSHASTTLKADSKPTDNYGNKMDKRTCTFSQEAQSVPDIQKLQCSLQSLSSITSNDVDSNILRLPLWDKASAEFCFAKSRELLSKPLNITSYSGSSEMSQGTLTPMTKESYYEDIMHGLKDQSLQNIINSDEKTISDNDTLTKKSSLKNINNDKHRKVKTNVFSDEEVLQSILVITEASGTLKRISKRSSDFRSSLKGGGKPAEKEYNSKSSSFDLLETIDRSLSKVGIFNSKKTKGSPSSPQFNTRNASMTPKSVKSPNASFFLFPSGNDIVIEPDYERSNASTGYEHDLDVYSPRSLQNGVMYKEPPNKLAQQYDNNFQGIPKSDSFSNKKSVFDPAQCRNNKPTNSVFEGNSIYVQQIDGKKYVVAAPKNYGFDSKMIFSTGLHNSNTSIHSAYQVPKTPNPNNDYYSSRPRALSFSERNVLPHPCKSNFTVQKVLSSKSIKARNLRRQSYNPGVYDVDTSSSDSDVNLDYSISHSECDIRLIMNKTSAQTSKHVRQLSYRKTSKKPAGTKISSKLSTSNSSIRSVPQNFMAASSGIDPVSSEFISSRPLKTNVGSYFEPFDAQYNHANVRYMMKNNAKITSQKIRPHINEATYRSENREFAEELLRIKPKPVLATHHLHPGYGMESSNFDVSKLTGKSPPPSQNFLNYPKGVSPTPVPPAFNWPEAISGSASSLTEEGKLAYEKLVVQPARLVNTLINICQKQGSSKQGPPGSGHGSADGHAGEHHPGPKHNHSLGSPKVIAESSPISSEFSKISLNKMELSSDKVVQESGNALPLPPRDRTVISQSSRKRHTRKYPLIIQDPTLQRTLNRLNHQPLPEHSVMTSFAKSTPSNSNVYSVAPTRTCSEILSAESISSHNFSTPYENSNVCHYQNVFTKFPFTSQDSFDTHSLKFEAQLENNFASIDCCDGAATHDDFELNTSASKNTDESNTTMSYSGCASNRNEPNQISNNEPAEATDYLYKMTNLENMEYIDRPNVCLNPFATQIEDSCNMATNPFSDQNLTKRNVNFFSQPPSELARNALFNKIKTDLQNLDMVKPKEDSKENVPEKIEEGNLENQSELRKSLSVASLEVNSLGDQALPAFCNKNDEDGQRHGLGGESGDQALPLVPVPKPRDISRQHTRLGDNSDDQALPAASKQCDTNWQRRSLGDNVDDLLSASKQSDANWQRRSLGDNIDELEPCMFAKGSPDRVSVEDLLEFADHKPCGRQRGTESDEVRIMCKVLNHQVTPETCLLTLEFSSWDVHRAIKLVRLRSLGRSPDAPSLLACAAALDSCGWEVARAAALLAAHRDEQDIAQV